MDHFRFRLGQLHAEDIPVTHLAEQFGTPLYVYSAATLLDHYRKFQQAFSALNPIICYSIKSLSNLAVLKLFAQEGSGFDVVSGGELYRALRAGGDPRKIVFAGVGKSDAEINEALDANIGWFNIESEMEFDNISRLAAARGQVAHGALRINPDVESAGTHVKTLTGKKQTKFGVDIDRAFEFIASRWSNPNVRLDAIHLHIGSPIKSTAPYVLAVTKTLELIDQLGSAGIEMRTLDIGGGFAAFYEGDEAPSAAVYADAMVPLIRNHARGRELQIIFEPGRSISCNAGILVTRVEYLKQSGEKRFVVVDAAMTELIRPTLYDAYHFIWPAAGEEPPSRRHDLRVPGDVKVDVVGPVCESGDFLAKDRYLPAVARGDLLAVYSTGAYGSVMGSQYNSRPKPAEVLVDGGAVRVIRQRETYADLVTQELAGLAE